MSNLLETDLATVGKGASSVKPDGGAAAFVLLTLESCAYVVVYLSLSVAFSEVQATRIMSRT